MRFKQIGALLAASAVLCASAYPGLWVDVLSETIPAGGTVQIKYTLTESSPISVPGPRVVLNLDLFDKILGVNLLNSKGDVSGAAVVQGATVTINYVSRHKTFGTDIKDPYPWMTIAAHVRPDAPVGQQFTLNLGPYDPEYNVNVQTGTFTVGGSISISNVIPGGGKVAAGSVISVLGTGFHSGMTLRAPGLSLSMAALISSTEIQLILAQSAVLDGQQIRLDNHDGTSVTYYSYMRGNSIASSSLPLFGATMPIFSTQSTTFAQFQSLPPIAGSQVYGLALENPESSPVRISVCLYSARGALITSEAFDLPGRARITQTLTELLGTTPLSGMTVQISGSDEFRIVGLLGDTSAGTVVPVDLM